jgi:hypothetical protein
MKQNFADMNVSELRAYVLAHREDETAFQMLIDRLKANASGVQYPCPNTPDTIAVTRKAIRERLGKRD